MWHLRPEVSTQADIEYIEEEVPSMLNSRLALVQYIHIYIEIVYQLEFMYSLGSF